ncbi:DUF222 domain-containing protein [Glycomyces luteolus]|uniref:DUF222 domain-containing protein n=1 Tax=Glycomyces luteolus TaxID=2670330 RepID=A0A9X3P4C7_9ACTN|nr:HNH endonuclease signature motif containing protein [Glycomyces luteolus]MDA1358443.1 DUF222 domain-containing protein [Glycomyces luteolus]
MSRCTTTPVPVPPLASDRPAQAAAIRSTLDEAAAAINTQHAQVLSAVIAMKEQNLHRSEFGFSALRDLLVSQFDFTFNTAGAIAAIARLSGKFRVLAEAATTGKARIDQVAFAVRQLDQTTAMRHFARTPFKNPVPSPFDPQTLCTTPEAMVTEYCAHATFKDLRRHLDELWASIAEATELFDELGQQSMQRLDLTPQHNGMWALEGQLSDATGRLLEKYLKTACPPPRQDETDTDGILPPQANRHAEALHQLLAGYGASPQASTRHGHTATLNLVVDIETLQGHDTGRTPLLEGQPISPARARLLACEAAIIPAVFNYRTGEAVELGRAERLPNAALRRKLELEQPDGCAWHGCGRPVAWTEAHHLQHWADGGPTVAENLILLCRFHHGRIHTPGWTIEKTGPGTAVITHHDSHDTQTGPSQGGQGPSEGDGCGCSDWRTDKDMDAEHRDDDFDYFPTGLYRTEWSETLKPDLDALAEAIDHDRAVKAMRAAKAKCRETYGTPTPPAGPAVPGGPPPWLGCPPRWQPGRGREGTPPACRGQPPSSNPHQVRAYRHARQRQPTPAHTHPPPTQTLNRPGSQRRTRSPSPPCRR